jgi:hypothetical protein
MIRILRCQFLCDASITQDLRAGNDLDGQPSLVTGVSEEHLRKGAAA